MEKGRYIFITCIVCIWGCSSQQASLNSSTLPVVHVKSLPPDSLSDSPLPLPYGAGRGALLLTRFSSMEEFRKIVHIEYEGGASEGNAKNSRVRLVHTSGNKSVQSELRKGVSERDFVRARDSSFWARASLVFRSPYSVWNRKRLSKMYALSRRRGAVFGEGDVAFFDLAESMTAHIVRYDRERLTPKDLSDKGFINTFNHVIAQAFITSIYSEKLADLIADSHERFAMPELITGVFTEEQLSDIEHGPVDNYLDIINNEWGQELGKQLREQFEISSRTTWNAELLAAYLNEMQRYFSWAFEIGFTPFYPTDEVVIRFSEKVNVVMDEAPQVR